MLERLLAPQVVGLPGSVGPMTRNWLAVIWGKAGKERAT